MEEIANPGNINTCTIFLLYDIIYKVCGGIVSLSGPAKMSLTDKLMNSPQLFRG